MIEVISTAEKKRLTAKLIRIRSRNVALNAELVCEVEEIIKDVRERGDAALFQYGELFDGVVLRELLISEETLKQTASRADADVREAICASVERVRAFHQVKQEQSWEVDGPNGVRLGQRVTPIERAGLYVPGGTAGYPSSVVMNVVPAQIAGVDRIMVATPPRTLQENPAVAAALVELGITEVYAVGGAQAIAALAYGTESIPRVDKITGPGNRYVAAAKRLVFGVVGIDSIAGPTEVVIIADDSARPSFIASDLLAQAEHGEDASAVLITTSKEIALEVLRELALQMHKLPRLDVIEKSLENYGAIVVVDDIEEATALVNDLAPEHLQIVADNEEEILSRIRHAGAIFMGEYSPEVVGDYLAGPNHVLPTSGAARFSSALGVQDFRKKTSIIRFSSTELRSTAPMIAALAHAEGLDAHASSALIRLE